MPRSDELAFRESGITSSNPWLGVVVGGKYRIEAVLGKGGMGTVYRATHELSLAPVALKILHPRLAQQPDAREDLIAEAQRASRLRGEHVARILDVGESPDASIFVAMELVEGCTLADFLAAHGALPPELVRCWLMEMAQALHSAHEAGLVHRDLSTSNVLVERQGSRSRLKIVDFGISAQLGASPRADELWIKPPYTAPEMLSRQSCDERADLFALGVIGYEMLTGRAPFAGGSLDARVRSVLEDAPAAWDVPGIPARLRRLLESLMEKDPEQRPGSAGEVLDTLVAMDRGPSLFLRLSALLLFMFAGILAIRDLFSEELPFLLVAPGAQLFLTTSPPGPTSPVQVIRVEDLERVPFNIGGLGGAQLRISAFDGASRLFCFDVPESLPPGRLLLDVDRSPAWAAVVKALSERFGISDLVFSALSGRGERPLAWARLLVDVEPPRFVRLEFSPKQGLRNDSKVTLSLADDIDTQVLRFRLLENDGGQIASYEVEAPSGPEQTVPLGKILAGKGVPARRNVSLELEVVDRAGRKAVRTQRFDYADFVIPRILDVRSIVGDSGLRVTKGRADMIVRLSEVGEGSRLRVHARLQAPGREAIDLETKVLAVLPGAELRVSIAAPPFPSSVSLPFVFTLEDPAGNRSDFDTRLRFRNLSLEPAFELVSPTNPFRLRGRKLICAAGEYRVRYRCNPEYTPMLAMEGAAAPSSVREESHSSGGLEFSILASKEQDQFEVSIAHVLRGEEDPRRSLLSGTERVSLTVLRLPKPPFVEVQSRWISGKLWSPALLGADVLVQRQGGVSLGAPLLSSIPKEAEAQGRIWQQDHGHWRPLPGPESQPLVELRQQVIELPRGVQALGLELRDVLGRPLQARDQNASPLQALDVAGRRVMPLLVFRHDPRPPRLPQEILVAWDEDVTVQIENQAHLDPRAQVSLLPPQLWPDSQGYAGTVRREEHSWVVRLRLPFGDVARWCGWDGLDSREFLSRPAEERRFIYRTPAGQFPVTLRFRPTRSLLRSQSLAAIAGKAIPAELDMLLVPFRGPRGAERFAIGLARKDRVPGSFALDERVEVQGVGEFFLGASEVTRAAYASFVSEVVANPLSPRMAKALGHVEDPLGAERFSRKGLLPDLRLFVERDFDAWVSAGPERPVTGLSYFQAQAFCRWLSQRVFADPGLLRLPFAAELEWAALGELGGEAQNGLRRSPVSQQGLARSFQRARGEAQRGKAFLASRWPATAFELRVIGDQAPGLDEQLVSGLDFGVREWCEDVPAFDRGLARDLFRRIASNLPAHRDFTRLRRTQRGAGLEPEFQRWLRLGVVRGLSWAEPDIAGDVLGWLNAGRGRFRSRVLGVRRSVQIARDGSGLSSGSIDPMVQVIGFRVAGSRLFLERVRRQVR